MPSVPSRLVVVFGCALALGLTSPALADKDPNKPPPPPLQGLAPPGQSSGGSQGGGYTPAAVPPSAPPPPSYYTPKENKGKWGNGNPGKGNGNGHWSASPQQTQEQPSYQPKVNEHKDVSPPSAPATSTGGVDSTAAAATPAGGTPTATPPATTPAVTTPPAQNGAVSAPKTPSRHRHHRTSRPQRHRRSSRLPAARVVPPAIVRTALPAAAPAAAAPAPARAKKPAPKPQRDTLSGLHVSVVTRTVRDVVRVIPAPVKAVIAAMAALLLAAIAAWTAVTVRARRLRRQRGQLLQEVGLLQAALLPEVPERIGPLAASVAYRPADGPGAGGDFYDVFQLENGNVGLVLGDVAGHGRDALARTALLRYTLRAYLETGLEPRVAVRLAGETLEHNLGSGFATAAVAVHDPAAGTLTYSCAGHPPPILLGAPAHEPVIAYSAPPIGVGERTGLRQTTVALPAGSLACFFTDGLAEARVNGELLGRERLTEIIEELDGEPTAAALLEAIRHEVHRMPDDMAACVLRPLGPVAVDAAEPERTEEVELQPGCERELRRFLAACGIPAVEVGDIVRSAAGRLEREDGALVRVRVPAAGERPHVSLVLPVAETLESAVGR